MSTDYRQDLVGQFLSLSFFYLFFFLVLSHLALHAHLHICVVHGYLRVMLFFQHAQSSLCWYVYELRGHPEPVCLWAKVRSIAVCRGRNGF